MKKRLLLTVAAALCLTFSIHRGDSQSKLRIGYRSTSTTDVLLSVVLREQGLLRDYGLSAQFVEFASPQEVGLSLMTERIDAALFLGYEHALRIAATKPGGWRALAAVVEWKDRPHYFLVARSESRIENPHQLGGRTFGYFPPTPTMKSLSDELVRHNRTEVKLYPLSINSVLPSLKLGQIDAVFGPEPAPSIAVRERIGVVLNSKRGLMAEIFGEPFPILLGIVRADVGDETVSRLRAAFDRAIQHVRDNPSASRVLLGAAVKGDLKTVTSVIALPSYEKVKEIDKRQFERVYRYQVSIGLLKESLELEKLWD